VLICFSVDYRVGGGIFVLWVWEVVVSWKLCGRGFCGNCNYVCFLGCVGRLLGGSEKGLVVWVV
jgi:hypothetical protein